MSNASTKLIKPDYMKWATGNNVITKLTGNMEHIDLADYKRSDLVIVYPSTANTWENLQQELMIHQYPQSLLWRLAPKFQ